MARTRTLAAVVAGAAALVAAACVPPPPPPPAEWMAPGCYEAIDSSNFAFEYHGPENTRFNATGFLNGGGLCVGDGLRTGNIVRADTEAEALGICDTILSKDFTVLGVTDLDTTHVGVPADSWICLFGP